MILPNSAYFIDDRKDSVVPIMGTAEGTFGGFSGMTPVIGDFHRYSIDPTGAGDTIHCSTGSLILQEVKAHNKVLYDPKTQKAADQ